MNASTRMIYGFVLALTLSFVKVEAANYSLTDCSLIKPTIVAAQPGDIVSLPDKVCSVPSSILVPDGVTIEGQGGSILQADWTGYSSTYPIFYLNQTDEAKFYNFGMVLGNNVRAFRADDPSSKLIFQGLNIRGNMLEGGTSSIAFYVLGSSEVQIDSVNVYNTAGGIYLPSLTKARITNSKLQDVNFGNIVFSGSDVVVSHNVVIDAGKAPIGGQASGDGITIGGNTSNVRVFSNTFIDGHCYQIQIYGGANNIVVSNNNFDNGVTSGVYLRPGVLNTTITQNTFRKNSHGVAVESSSSGINVLNNTFIEDTIFVAAMSGNVFANNRFINQKLSIIGAGANSPANRFVDNVEY